MNQAFLEQLTAKTRTVGTLTFYEDDRSKLAYLTDPFSLIEDHSVYLQRLWIAEGTTRHNRELQLGWTMLNFALERMKQQGLRSCRTMLLENVTEEMDSTERFFVRAGFVVTESGITADSRKIVKLNKVLTGPIV